VGELLDRIGSGEVAEWEAEFKLRAEDEQQAIDEAKRQAEEENA
jgi:hypothetical protein